MAKHRLNLLGRRLLNDPELKRKYTDNIRDALVKGYAEPVTDVNRSDGCVWYLPHYPVMPPGSQVSSGWSLTVQHFTREPH